MQLCIAVLGRLLKCVFTNLQHPSAVLTRAAPGMNDDASYLGLLYPTPSYKVYGWVGFSIVSSDKRDF